MSSDGPLRRIDLDKVTGTGFALSAGAANDPAVLKRAAEIVESVRLAGEPALRRWAEELGDIPRGAPLVLGDAELSAARDALPADQRALLERTASRIWNFAEAQMGCLQELHTSVPGGEAGHEIAPVVRAGCYAPGGRYPLPSSVLMTVLTARVAGVDEVWLASPKPAPVTLAAAKLGGVAGVLAAGGAQAIAALAYGAGEIPACDVIAGPGNRWVTAAKQLVSGRVGIDMLAGPSELLVIADHTADAALIAADLLAQAEHDTDAKPMLIALDRGLIDRVNAELDRQLDGLSTAATARPALMHNGWAIFAPSRTDAARLADQAAPEHLELMVEEPEEMAARLHHYGALFIGPRSAEVLGDYGAGPNHVLPTGGAARFAGGLSVLTFLRVRTWLRMHDGDEASRIARDAAALARLEGLEAHARAAERRV